MPCISKKFSPNSRIRVNSEIASSGFILLDKPEGVTSCKALIPLRKIFHTRRVGHAGSLDLRASGLIVAAIGRATRLLPFVEAGEKAYIFDAHFGYSTVTDEWDGELVEEDPETAPIFEENVREILGEFVGEIEQIPPDFSAVKLGGKRASDLKRKGRELNLKSRKITIRELSLLGKTEPPENAQGKLRASYRFSCVCSKGTYIRSLVRDLAKRLGTLGTASGIRRTRIGHLDVSMAKAPTELCESSLIKPQYCLQFPSVILTDRQVDAVRNGRAMTWNGTVDFAADEHFVFAVGRDGELKALCQLENGKLAPKFYLGSENG